MLKRFGLVFGAALMIGGSASANSVLLDFGNAQGSTNRTRQQTTSAANDIPGSPPTADNRFYNEIANDGTAGPIPGPALSLVDSTGAATSSTYVLVDAWRNMAQDGNPTHYDPLLHPHLYPNQVAKDNGIEVTKGDGVTPDDDNTAGFNITGLNPATSYRLTFFGSGIRADASGNLIDDSSGGGTFSKYSVTGLIPQSVTEHTINNYLHTVFLDALPAADGSFRVDLTPDVAAYIAFYGHTASEYQAVMNVLEITPTAEAVPEPAGLGLLVISASGAVRRTRRRS